MNTAYIIDAVRTPVGKYGGKLAGMRPDDMLAYVINALLQRNENIDVRVIEQVIAGDANQAGEDCRNVARMAALLTGLPANIPGTTVNSLCASGMEAIMQAAQGIQCGNGLLYIAGGVESMTRAPFIVPKKEDWNTPSDAEIYNSTIGWRFTNSKLAAMYPPHPMGETAEHIAQKWGITREAQDAFALQSHQKYFAAQEKYKWDDEIVPVEMNTEDGLISWFTTDESPRKLTADFLSALKPAFIPNGTVTAGNAAGLNDGAAMLLLASEEAVKMFDLRPMVKIVSQGLAGVDPAIMGMAPVPATLKALRRAGLKIEDLNLVELNESFAAQVLACTKELGIHDQKLNVNGGSLAIGHPMGCSGARIVTTLVHEMLRSDAKFGLATTCAGMGQGAAIVLEKV